MDADPLRDASRTADPVFPPLDPDAIVAALTACGPGRAPAWTVRVVDRSTSTNTELLAAVRSAKRFTGPTLLTTEFQVAGRGRLGRSWRSRPGASLTVSFALRVDRPLARLEGVTLACGLAVRSVLDDHGIDARLKWPNDVLAGGRKLAGILVEAQPDGSRTILVVGVGINTAPHAHESDADARADALPMADLETCSGAPVDRNRLAARLALGLDAALAVFARAGFASSVDAWNAVDAFHDRPATLILGEGRTLDCIARGVDAGGALLVDVDGERRRFITGEVSLRPAAGAP